MRRRVQLAQVGHIQRKVEFTVATDFKVRQRAINTSGDFAQADTDIGM